MFDIQKRFILDIKIRVVSTEALFIASVNGDNSINSGVPIIRLCHSLTEDFPVPGCFILLITKVDDVLCSIATDRLALLCV